MAIDNLSAPPHLTEQAGPPAENRAAAGREIRLVEMLLVISKNRRLIAATALVTAVLVAIYSLFVPNIYTATARVLPPQQTQSTASMLLGQLGGLGGMAAGQLGIKNPSAIYVSMLESRTVADALIQRFELQKFYKTPRMSDTRQLLADASQIAAGTDGLITVAVESKDPKQAAQLANGYVEELRKLTSTLAVTEASQRRMFFEQQLRSAKDDLAKAEIALKETQESTGMIQLDNQARAMIQSVATLRAEIAAKEVELSTMRSFATEQNPAVIRANEELAALRGQLAKLTNGPGGRGDVEVPTGKMPAAGLEYVRRLRDVRYYETLYEIMAKQFEAAKLDESKNSAPVQLLDAAVVPDRKSKPKRSIWVILAALIAAVLTTMFVFVREAVQQAAGDPAEAVHWRELKSDLRRPILKFTLKQ